jgi:probable phosphomutase (TIGR03848 family)
MTTILLIRHGENEYVKKGRLAGRLPEVHLNEKGIQQAQTVAEKLAGAPVKAVYSSPLERTMETAEPIARVLQLEVVPRQGLIETDFGEWQDKKVKGLSRLKIWRIVQFAPALMRFPQGESFAECQFRMVQELETLRAQHDPKDLIICVSHSDPIKLVVAYYLGLPLDLFQRLHIAPASISALGISAGGSRLLTLNYDLAFTLSNP